MNDKRPEPDTPEFDEWLIKRAQQHTAELFNVEIPDELADKVGSGIMVGPESHEDLNPEKTTTQDIKIDLEINKSHLKQSQVAK
jgi:hypothetical protein